MTGAKIAEQVCEGMKVFSSDGKRLGTIWRIHYHETEVYFEVLARGALLTMWPLEQKKYFLPANAVADVSGKRVILNMDVKAAKTCTIRPPWIPMKTVNPNFPGSGSGGGFGGGLGG